MAEKYEVERANLMRVRKQITGSLGDVDDRITTLELNPSGYVALNYKYTVALSGDPTSGHIGADTLDATTVTELRISNTTAAGNDASLIRTDIGIDDIIAIFEKPAPNDTSYYTVTATPVNETGWYSIAVTPLLFTGAGLPNVDDADTTVHIIPKTITNHEDLNEVHPDQHHAQIHAETHEIGGDDLVEHDKLTGLTTDNHHHQQRPADPHLGLPARPVGRFQSNFH